MIINWLYVDHGFRNQHTTVSTLLHTIGRHTWVQYRKHTMVLFPMSWDIVSTTKDSLHKVSIATRSGDRWVASWSRCMNGAMTGARGCGTLTNGGKVRAGLTDPCPGSLSNVDERLCGWKHNGFASCDAFASRVFYRGGRDDDELILL
jgi:hypothetical protein